MKLKKFKIFRKFFTGKHKKRDNQARRDEIVLKIDEHKALLKTRGDYLEKQIQAELTAIRQCLISGNRQGN
jgi:hypothetical protein